VEQFEFHGSRAKSRENRLILVEKPRSTEALVALRCDFPYPHLPSGTPAAQQTGAVEYCRDFHESSRTGRPFL
jgi:hypothetical protein